jgi:peptidoglycan hydrolase-like protein with peptidoglycan-binding domain
MEMIDVSYAQGAISQATFAAMSGIDRVVLRASRADSALAQDSVYGGNVARARAAGKKIGHYHFNGHVGSIATQAQFFLSHLSWAAGDVAVIDVETEGGVTQRYTPAETLEFAQAVHARLGVWPWVYMSQSVTNEDNWAAVAAVCPLWVASYSSSLGRIGYWKNWVAWQYTSSGSVAGLHPLDVSRYSGAPITGGSGSGAAAPAQGASQSIVKNQQHRLNVWKAATPPLVEDGIAGPKFQQATVVFQKAHGLTADGVIGAKTWALLVTNPPSAAPKPASKPSSKPVAAQPKTIQQVVQDQQRRLNVWGAMTPPLAVDGIPGPKFKQATIIFQKAHGLTPDGVIGAKTWALLVTNPPKH